MVARRDELHGRTHQLFVGWGTLALINAGLAQGKGRSGLVWCLLSLLLGHARSCPHDIVPCLPKPPDGDARKILDGNIHPREDPIVSTTIPCALLASGAVRGWLLRSAFRTLPSRLCPADHGEPLEREGRPGTVSQQVIHSL